MSGCLIVTVDGSFGLLFGRPGGRQLLGDCVGRPYGRRFDALMLGLCCLASLRRSSSRERSLSLALVATEAADKISVCGVYVRKVVGGGGNVLCVSPQRLDARCGGASAFAGTGTRRVCVGYSCSNMSHWSFLTPSSSLH